MYIYIAICHGTSDAEIAPKMPHIFTKLYSGFYTQKAKYNHCSKFHCASDIYLAVYIYIYIPKQTSILRTLKSCCNDRIFRYLSIKMRLVSVFRRHSAYERMRRATCRLSGGSLIISLRYTWILDAIKM